MNQEARPWKPANRIAPIGLRYAKEQPRRARGGARPGHGEQSNAPFAAPGYPPRAFAALRRGEMMKRATALAAAGAHGAHSRAPGYTRRHTLLARLRAAVAPYGASLDGASLGVVKDD